MGRPTDSRVSTKAEKLLSESRLLKSRPVIARIYGCAILVENDLGNGTSKLFSSIDEFSQVDKGKGEIKE